MNSVSEALNTLISAVNVAHNKGGIYSLEESHYIYLAISYLNSLQNQTPKADEVSPASVAVTPKISPSVTQGEFEDSQDY